MFKRQRSVKNFRGWMGSGSPTKPKKGEQKRTSFKNESEKHFLRLELGNQTRASAMLESRNYQIDKFS